jgi:hypothetical protein
MDINKINAALGGVLFDLVSDEIVEDDDIDVDTDTDDDTDDD